MKDAILTFPPLCSLVMTTSTEGFLFPPNLPHQNFIPKLKKILDIYLKCLYNISIMKKHKKQNLVAKYARKVCKAVRMQDKTKYNRYDKHKVKYNDSDNT